MADDPRRDQLCFLQDQFDFDGLAPADQFYFAAAGSVISDERLGVVSGRSGPAGVLPGDSVAVAYESELAGDMMLKWFI